MVSHSGHCQARSSVNCGEGDLLRLLLRLLLWLPPDPGTPEPCEEDDGRGGNATGTAGCLAGCLAPLLLGFALAVGAVAAVVLLLLLLPRAPGPGTSDTCRRGGGGASNTRGRGSGAGFGCGGDDGPAPDAGTPELGRALDTTLGFGWDGLGFVLGCDGVACVAAWI